MNTTLLQRSPARPEIPSLRRVRAAVRRERALDYSIIAGLVVTDVYLVWAVLTQGSWRSLLYALILLLLSTAIHLFGFLQLYTSPRRPLRHMKPTDRVGRYNGSEITSMVHELLRPHKGKEEPNIYITEPKYDGAYVVNSLFFNVIKPLNAVFLSRHLLQILRPNEIKAILAHELAHFYGYIGPLSRARFACMICNALLPAYLMLLGGQTSFVELFFLWIATSAVFIRCLGLLLDRQSRCHEYLADLSAARRYGILSVVNGLFAVMKTFEAQHHIQAELADAIAKDRQLAVSDLPELFAQIDARLPNRAISVRDLRKRVAEALRSPEADALRKPRNAKELKAKREELKRLSEEFLLNKTFQLVNWDSFDNVIPDGRVNHSEYPRLIATLVREPERQLFDVPTDNAPFVAKASHPTLRERILFLENCRQDDPSLSL